MTRYPKKSFSEDMAFGKNYFEISALLKEELSKVSSNFAENNIMAGGHLDEVTFR
jgi:hypothetical protein